MKSEFEVTNGQNIIDIFFDDFASCLVIKKGIAVNWPDCRGSIGEYYAISNFPTEERNLFTKNLDNVLINGSDIEQLESIKNFLNLFANGKYAINKCKRNLYDFEFLKSNNIIYSDAVPANERFSGMFYQNFNDDSSTILYSITNENINPKRVVYYCDLIKSGIKPSIITFGVFNELTAEYSIKYVLDGHHKIEAYTKLQENIPIISILKLEESVNKTSGLLYFAKPFLKDFEFLHLFENNDDNLLTINFTQEPDLTNYLDSILFNSKIIQVSIICVLLKYAKSNNNIDANWLNNRLTVLYKNPNTTILGLGKVLRVYEKRKDDRYGECWFPKNVKSKRELQNWIVKNIK